MRVPLFGYVIKILIVNNITREPCAAGGCENGLMCLLRPAAVFNQSYTLQKAIAPAFASHTRLQVQVRVRVRVRVHNRHGQQAPRRVRP